MPQHDTLDVLEAIYSTRAMRYLRPDPIAEETIWALLDAAIRGPSSGNSQPWAWLVVTDRETKQRIGILYLETWLRLGERRHPLAPVIGPLLRLAGRTPLWEKRRANTEWLRQNDINFRSGDHLAHHISEAPVWVIPVLPSARGDQLAQGASIYGCVQNLMLAARSLGIGSTLTTLHLRREQEVCRLLGLPPGARPAAIIPLGYPSRGKFSLPRRRPAHEVTYWERWGNQRQPEAQDTAPPGPAEARIH